MSSLPDPPSLPRPDVRSGLRAMARPSGGFAMLALDQRISLENMFTDAGLAAGPEALDAFRTSAVRALAVQASAILLDPGFVGRAPTPWPWPAETALIVAADHLHQKPGQPAHDSSLDRGAAIIAADHAAVALKLMVVWDPGRPNDGRVRMVEAFAGLAHEHGMLAVVEGVVVGDRSAGRERATPGELLDAASRLAAPADLYKGQVPIHAGDTPADIERLSADVTATVACPWVVLSTGVPPDRFGEGVAAACRGGASGFLAGRAIWRSAVGLDDPVAQLSGDGVARLAELATIVDAEARPWTDVVPVSDAGPADRSTAEPR